MTPTFHPRLVNGRSGDPALFVEMLHRKEALLFDLGDLSRLSARDLLRVGHAFVSHMHMDHFIGLDALLRLGLGREKCVRLVGPPGLCDRLYHKLQGYDWDLADRYEAEFVFEAAEHGADGAERGARFRFRNRFEQEEIPVDRGSRQVAGDGFFVTTCLLEHHGDCLGFLLTEPAHANVWKDRLAKRGLEPGAWLQELKRAILSGEPDDRIIGLGGGGSAPLGDLRDLVSIGPGQKVAYVTDVADTPSNRDRIVELAGGADLLFIEARFAAEDREQALDRAHLTTRAAGEIARAAGVRRVEPFHFSARYEEQEDRLLAQVRAAFEAKDVADAERMAGRTVE